MRPWLSIAIVLGCGPRVEVVGGGSSSGTTGGPTGSTSVGASSTTTTSTTSLPPPSETTTHGESSSDDDAPLFIIDPDGGGPQHECDPWVQNCPRGEKCALSSSDGWGWDSTKCTPIAEDPRGVGEACIVEGEVTSGVDDCELGAMCWNVDPQTNTGRCVALCEGSEANPTCDDACTSCYINANGSLLLCLFNCDPLTQNCGDGDGCYPINDAFACAPDLSGEAGGIGDACEFINVCDPGLLCANPEYVPGCQGSGCCTPFCDASAADICDALVPGTTCMPWYEEGQDPQVCVSGTVGFCGVAR